MVKIRNTEYSIEDIVHNISSKSGDENVLWLKVLITSHVGDYLIIIPKFFATFNLASCIFKTTAKRNHLARILIKKGISYVK